VARPYLDAFRSHAFHLICIVGYHAKVLCHLVELLVAE
jgi:hypothetical protein